MNLTDLKKRLPARTLTTLVAGVVLALGFLAVFIIPENREAEQLRRKIAETQSTLAMRRQLQPVAIALKQLETTLPTVGPVGGGARLPLADVSRLPDIFDAMATPYGLRMASVSPDPSSVSTAGELAVRLGVMGQAEAFRDFLLSLGRYGPLVRVESITSMIGREGREYSVKCWLAVE
ncbi:MAG: hypothetical protein AB9872_09600 [Solidesulfovibrio sp.]